MVKILKMLQSNRDMGRIKGVNARKTLAMRIHETLMFIVKILSLTLGKRGAHWKALN